MNVGRTVLFVLAAALLIAAAAVVLTPSRSMIGAAEENHSEQKELSSRAGFNISSSGTATVYFDPDKATVTVGVETSAYSAKEAQEQTTQKMNKILEAIKNLGIPEDQIKTTTYRLYAEYDWTQNGRVFKGYKAMHYVTVTCYDLNRIGKVIDAASDNGANHIGDVSFGLKPETMAQARRQAIKQAVANAEGEARAAAESAAQASGKALGTLDPVKIVIGGQYYQPYYYPVPMAAAGAGESGETQVQPGQISVTVSVSADFKAEFKE